ncbi:DNA-binding response regulator, NarL/FixJ family, contains REC and HTH domains [Amycolatopsis xylanica]|uniref:DNA-binding response regulator, NarL/FixJ family, contains REC and HTH domains n=1 Tax=Amycolatopsis xylanica TaxID=589385 RepID=A0A1H3R470_9PSEU|nr:response regulator transcription factor [Amycolatopsis xylanica]SDZ20632.1 DNA-binding response regulator, NarL/FixJ family, contains REC and HTH domains [Amycolatopsis xylanica]
MESISMLVVDDEPVIRYALRSLFGAADGVEEVNEAGTGEEAILECEKNSPDLVITELRLSGSSDGVEICQFAKEHLDGASVMVFAADASPASVAAALNAGADSFVHKTASNAELLDAVRRTRSGERAWILGEQKRPPGEPAPAAAMTLTQREESVLAFVLRRWSNAEIAAEMCLARQTVKNYVSRVLQKLGYASRAELFCSLDVKAGDA